MSPTIKLIFASMIAAQSLIDPAQIRAIAWFLATAPTAGKTCLVCARADLTSTVTYSADGWRCTRGHTAELSAHTGPR